MDRSYSEMLQFEALEDRYAYLKLSGRVGEDTFGYERFLNQRLYKSRRWKQTRDLIIVRDNGRDLALPDLPVYGSPVVHHINPLTPYDIEHQTNNLYDPENLILVSNRMHNAIHYGNGDQIPRPFVLTERRPGDTNLY